MSDSDRRYTTRPAEHAVRPPPGDLISSLRSRDVPEAVARGPRKVLVRILDRALFFTAALLLVTLVRWLMLGLIAGAEVFARAGELFAAFPLLVAMALVGSVGWEVTTRLRTSPLGYGVAGTLTVLAILLAIGVIAPDGAPLPTNAEGWAWFIGIAVVLGGLTMYRVAWEMRRDEAEHRRTRPSPPVPRPAAGNRDEPAGADKSTPHPPRLR